MTWSVQVTLSPADSPAAKALGSALPREGVNGPNFYSPGGGRWIIEWEDADGVAKAVERAMKAFSEQAKREQLDDLSSIKIEIVPATQQNTWNDPPRT